MEEKIAGEDCRSKRADEAWKCEDAVAVDVDHPQWVKYMEEKLASKSKNCQPSYRFTICRVPLDIRRVDSVAYNPLIVSIGPYHRGDRKRHQMEEVKWRNLNEFRRRRTGDDFNKYLEAMKEIEPQARACYSGNINMKANEFIEMMLLDGLFIIQLLLNRSTNYFLFQLVGISSYGEDPSYTIDGMLCRIGHDMLLLENQVPVFVLQRLWNLIYPEGKYTLWKEASDFIRRFAMRFEHEWDFELLTEKLAKEKERYKNKKEPELNVGGFHHFLHLVCLILKPTLTGKPESMEFSAELPAVREKIHPFRESMDRAAKLPAVIMKWFELSMEYTRKHAAAIKKKKILRFFISLFESKKETPPLKVIPSAVELDEAGVTFECVKANSFLDVEFKQGTMKMPRLSVQCFNKSLFRNFIAFEQCFPTRGRHFTSYCSFMDYLVNTRRDVEILKQSKIIENRVGSDKEVAVFFNDLCKGIFVSGFKDSYLADSFEQVTYHTKKTWPKWRAKLKHDYFSNPWAIISLIAATFVIFLTSVQTYKAAFP